jgi:hypothetical protein
VEVVALSLVKEDGEFLLADQLGEAAGRSDVSRGQRSERGGVQVLRGPDRSDELPVLVDEEDDLRVRFARQALANHADLLELLVVHHHLRLHSL